LSPAAPFFAGRTTPVPWRRDARGDELGDDLRLGATPTQPITDELDKMTNVIGFTDPGTSTSTAERLA
jgi:hypothetical protein